MNETTDKKTRRQIRRWRRIIRHGWYTCPDGWWGREYSQRLFALFADQPVDWSVTGVLTFIGALYGAMAGMLWGIVADNWNVPSPSPSDLDALWIYRLARLISGTWNVPSPSDLAAPWVSHLSWIVPGLVSGTLIGLFIGSRVRRILTWRRWLRVYDADIDYYRNDWGMNLLGSILPIMFLVGSLFWGACATQGRGLLLWIAITLVLSGGYSWAHFREGGLKNGSYGTLVVGSLVWVAYGIPVGPTFILGSALGVISYAVYRAYSKTYDEIFGDHLLLLLPPSRPSRIELEEALRRIGGASFAEALRQVDDWREKMPPIERLLRLFSEMNGPLSFEAASWSSHFAAYHTLVYAGGEAVDAWELCHPGPMQVTTWSSDTSRQMLRDISYETSKRIGHRASHLLCSRCLAHCTAHNVHITRKKRFCGGQEVDEPDQTVTFYGCRVCKQSREFIEHAGEVVAVLEAHWNEERRQTDGVLRVNWHKRRTIFDFDKVAIAQATDEDVERFCVQVANDSDPYRCMRYRKIPVTVASSCPLSENSLRILRSTFRHVESRS